MQIAVLGAGNVGGTLGRRWARAENDVTFGVRNPADGRMQALVHEIGPNAKATTVAEAANRAAVVVLTVPWESAQEALREAGDRAGKILVDATNPPIMTPEGLQQGLVIGHTISAAEQIAHWAIGAHVVKGFNTTGWQNMADPLYGSPGLAMLLYGDHAEPKKVVAVLAKQLGFEPVDVGPLRSARYLEVLAMWWIEMAIFQGWVRLNKGTFV